MAWTEYIWLVWAVECRLEWETSVRVRSRIGRVGAGGEGGGVKSLGDEWPQLLRALALFVRPASGRTVILLRREGPYRKYTVWWREGA